MNLLKQASTAQSLTFLLVDSTDHVSPKTGLAPAVTLSKNGAAFASPAGAVTEIGNGWYKVAGNATDTGTLGELILHATGSGADPTDRTFAVVAFDPQLNSLGLSLAKGTNLTGLNDLSAAQVNAEADSALADVGLTTTITGRIDATVSSRSTFAGGAVASVTAPVAVTGDAALAATRLLTMLSLNSGAYRFTAPALALAPSGSGGGSVDLTALEAAAVKLVAAVYDSASVTGSTITLSNGAQQAVSSGGRVTTEP